ncbi:hypothetical protein DENSPDRAFT_934126 [Dentipellis sp. KUC8613]|nr:hypothetical protein DENSPDRAFT_934126 [Dentipellis sp. KUC8613]
MHWSISASTIVLQALSRPTAALSRPTAALSRPTARLATLIRPSPSSSRPPRPRPVRAVLALRTLSAASARRPRLPHAVRGFRTPSAASARRPRALRASHHRPRSSTAALVCLYHPGSRPRTPPTSLLRQASRARALAPRVHAPFALYALSSRLYVPSSPCMPYPPRPRPVRALRHSCSFLYRPARSHGAPRRLLRCHAALHAFVSPRSPSHCPICALTAPHLSNDAVGASRHEWHDRRSRRAAPARLRAAPSLITAPFALSPARAPQQRDAACPSSCATDVPVARPLRCHAAPHAFASPRMLSRRLTCFCVALHAFMPPRSPSHHFAHLSNCATGDRAHLRPAPQRGGPHPLAPHRLRFVPSCRASPSLCRSSPSSCSAPLSVLSRVLSPSLAPHYAAACLIVSSLVLWPLSGAAAALSSAAADLSRPRAGGIVGLVSRCRGSL